MIWLAWLLDVAVAVAAPPAVKSVDVVCHESTLAVMGAESELHVRRRGAGYSDGKRTIDPHLVEALAAALQAPPVPSLRPAELAPTRAALRKAIEKASIEPPVKREALAATANRKLVYSSVGDTFSDHWFDDIPDCTVTLTLEGGRRLSATSKSQSDFMIPWTLRGRETFSPRIGRALAALLPAKFLQRERLAGEGFVNAVAERLVHQVARSLNR
jgi:hypothetical protein